MPPPSLAKLGSFVLTDIDEWHSTTSSEARISELGDFDEARSQASYWTARDRASDVGSLATSACAARSMMAQASAGVDDDEQAADLGKLEEIDQMLADGLPKAPPREHPDLDDDLLQAHKRQRPEAAQAALQPLAPASSYTAGPDSNGPRSARAGPSIRTTSRKGVRLASPMGADAAAAAGERFTASLAPIAEPAPLSVRLSVADDGKSVRLELSAPPAVGMFTFTGQPAKAEPSPVRRSNDQGRADPQALKDQDKASTEGQAVRKSGGGWLGGLGRILTGRIFMRSSGGGNGASAGGAAPASGERTVGIHELGSDVLGAGADAPGAALGPIPGGQIITVGYVSAAAPSDAAMAVHDATSRIFSSVRASAEAGEFSKASAANDAPGTPPAEPLTAEPSAAGEDTCSGLQSPEERKQEGLNNLLAGLVAGGGAAMTVDVADSMMPVPSLEVSDSPVLTQGVKRAAPDSPEWGPGASAEEEAAVAAEVAEEEQPPATPAPIAAAAAPVTATPRASSPGSASRRAFSTVAMVVRKLLPGFRTSSATPAASMDASVSNAAPAAVRAAAPAAAEAVAPAEEAAMETSAAAASAAAAAGPEVADVVQEVGTEVVAVAGPEAVAAAKEPASAVAEQQMAVPAEAGVVLEGALDAGSAEAEQAQAAEAVPEAAAETEAAAADEAAAVAASEVAVAVEEGPAVAEQVAETAPAVAETQEEVPSPAAAEEVVPPTAPAAAVEEVAPEAAAAVAAATQPVAGASEDIAAAVAVTKQEIMAEPDAVAADVKVVAPGKPAIEGIELASKDAVGTAGAAVATAPPEGPLAAGASPHPVAVKPAPAQAAPAKKPSGGCFSCFGA